MTETAVVERSVLFWQDPRAVLIVGVPLTNRGRLILVQVGQLRDPSCLVSGEEFRR